MAVSFIRTLIIFAVLMIAMRIMGKRQLGELEPSELVVAVLISNLAAQPLQDIGIPLLYGLVPVLTLFAGQVIISGLTMSSIRFREIICGKPSILIDNGVIQQKEMRKNRISLDELYSELRAHNVTDISAVKHAILETDGSLNVLLFPSESPATPRQLSLEVPDPGAPVIVISNGRILSHNLRMLGLNEQWLKKQLSLRKTENAEDVYLMTVDSEHDVYFVKKEDTK